MRAGVIALVGLPGAGKSTLAAALAERLPGARVLDKDKVRHVLFDPCDYTSAERDVVFAAMLDAARYHLGRDRIVIFDGLTFSRRSQVAAEMEEPSGDYVTLDMTGDPARLAEQALAYVEEAAGEG